MRSSRDLRALRVSPSLLRLTLPLALLLALLLSWALPRNPALWDALNRALPTAPDPRVVVIGIDEASLRDYGRLDTWDRSLYARALATLQAAGVRAVGLDILFDTPAPGDAALRAALAAPNVVVATHPESAPTALTSGPALRTGLSALNIDRDGIVRSYQRAYRLPGGVLASSLSARLAEIGGAPLRPTDRERPATIRLLASTPAPLPILSFRDTVSGNVRFSALQDKLVLIGVTAPGTAGNSFLDASRSTVPGAVLQARALSSQLSAPFVAVPGWLRLLLCLSVALAAVLLRGLWGMVLALLAVAAALPLWLLNIQFPGVTVSLCAIAALLLVAAERWWQLRHLGTLDPLTGLGNRLAFTRAVEHRWAGRLERPLGLLLVDLAGLREINDHQGRRAGDVLLRDLAARIRSGKRRGDVVFRWGADEFAVLVDQTDPHDLHRYAERLQLNLADLGGEASLRPSVGHAVTGPDIRTPAELVERASRIRYRNKYRES